MRGGRTNTKVALKREPGSPDYVPRRHLYIPGWECPVMKRRQAEPPITVTDKRLVTCKTCRMHLENRTVTAATITKIQQRFKGGLTMREVATALRVPVPMVEAAIREGL